MKNYRCLGPIRNLKVAGITNAGVFECFYIFAPAQGLVAQWIEQQPSKLRAIGSNPIGVTSKQKPVNHLITGFCFFSAQDFYRAEQLQTMVPVLVMQLQVSISEADCRFRPRTFQSAQAIFPWFREQASIRTRLPVFPLYHKSSTKNHG